jgi:superfamily I DNA/RNA helicase
MDLIKIPDDITGEGLQYAQLDEKEITKIKKQKTLEEERRLFFVAITRAEQNLFIGVP